MTRTANKLLIFILSGLFWLAVPPSFAADAQTSNTETANAVIKMQSAHEFMKENLTGSAYQEFKKFAGESSQDVNIIPCGETLCNLTYSTCLYKERHREFREDINALFGRDNETIVYDYVCVSQNEASSYTDAGWKTVSEDHDNVRKTVKTTKNGEVKRDTSKQFEIDDKACFTAMKTADQGATKYCVKAIGNKLEVHSANNDNKSRCEVVPVRWYNNKKCAFCPMFGVVFAAADQMTVISRDAFVIPFSLIIVVGLALWIAVKTLSFVSSLTKQDAAKYITELLRQSYKFVIAFLLLLNYNNVFNYIIDPLLNTGIEFGNKFVEVENWKDRFGANTPQEMSDLPADYQRNLNNEYYKVGTYQKMEQLAYNVNKSFTLLQTIGQSLMCLGLKYMALKITNDIFTQFGLGFDCLIYGIFFGGFGFLLCIAFIFYLLDAVVQLGIVGALLPFLIACWPFKITSKYTSTGFKMLLNSIFTFMMMGVVANLCIQLINASFMQSSEGTSENLASGGLAALVTALDTIDTESLKEMVNVFSLAFLLFVFANILGFLVVGRITELVDKFASGGMKPVAPSIATMGASTVKGMATKLAAPTTEAVSEWAEEKVATATRWGVNKAVGVATLRPVRQWIKNRKNKGDDKDTGPKPQPDNPQPTGANNPPSPGGGAEAQSSTSRPTVIGGGAQGRRSETRQTRGNAPAQATVGNRGQSAEARQNQGQAPGQPGGRGQGAETRQNQGQPGRQPQNGGRPAGAPATGASAETRQTPKNNEQLRSAPDTQKQSAAETTRRPGNFVRGGKPTTVGNGRRPDKPKLDELD